MDVVGTIFDNLNTWLVVLITGVIVWAARQILPYRIERTKLWKKILRVAPILIGAGIAMIPGLRPIEGSLVQSAAVGLIGGSFSQWTYSLARELVGEKMKAAMGSKASRQDN
jgi:hypothetical protein